MRRPRAGTGPWLGAWIGKAVGVEDGVVHGAAARAAIRWVATAATVLGIGCEREPPVIPAPPAAARSARTRLPVLPSTAPSDPPPPAPPLEPFPDYFKHEQATVWVCIGKDLWALTKRRFAALSSSPSEDELRYLAESVGKFGLSALVGLRAVPIAELEAALDKAERQGLYDPFVAAAVFARTRGAPIEDLPRLLARVERHARFAVALQRARASTGPVEFRPWMSKSGRDTCSPVLPANFIDEAVAAYRTGDAGTWDTEVLLTLEWIEGDAVLIRRGESSPVGRGRFKLRRLDILRAGASDTVLAHPRLGRLTIPAGSAMGPWNVADYLTPAARRALEASVRTAAAGDPRAPGSLQAVLPAAQSFIAEEIRDRPASTGAPALRLLSTLFLE